MLRKVETEGQTEDGWTMVQYKHSSRKPGLGDSTHNIESRPESRGRECKAITKTNGSDKCCNNTMIILKGAIHEGEWKGDREATREQNKIELRLHG